MSKREEAVALYETAKAELEAINNRMTQRRRESVAITTRELLDAQKARTKVFLAGIQLSRQPPPSG